MTYLSHSIYLACCCVFIGPVITAETPDFKPTASLTMRLVFDGVPPPRPEPMFWGGNGGRPIVDESLLVDLDDGGIANVIVYLRRTENPTAVANWRTKDCAPRVSSWTNRPACLRAPGWGHVESHQPKCSV